MPSRSHFRPRSCLALVPSLVLLASAVSAEDANAALDRALAATPAKAEPAVTAPAEDGHDHHPPTSATISPRLLDISLAVLGAAGASTARDAELADLEGGAHDPKRRGFNLQTAELSLSGAVDPYFEGEAHIAISTEGVELEEAFLRTTSLPEQLELKAGFYLTEFGRINSTHVHAWSWLDQPVIASRVFGGEGWRAAGARASWLAPLPWFSQLMVGAQNANDPAMNGLMGGDPAEGIPSTIGGRPESRAAETVSAGDLAWNARLDQVWSLGDSALGLGFSGLVGPNLADGTTSVGGIDARWKWTEAGTGRFIRLDAEGIARRYGASAATVMSGDGSVTQDLAAEDLTDHGVVVAVEVGFADGWTAGLRGEWVTGSGESVVVDVTDTTVQVSGDRASDPTRDDRWRVSPLLSWRPSEFSRLRLQYNLDRATSLDEGRAHTVWLGADILLGAHPAHGW